MIWISPNEILLIHSEIIKITGGMDGVRDMSLLESAVNAPFQTFGGEELFKTDLEKIARIGYGLASNHAFIDGNKRIGAMVTQLLLKWNNYKLELKTGELSDMFISIAVGNSDAMDLYSWIKSHLIF